MAVSVDQPRILSASGWNPNSLTVIDEVANERAIPLLSPRGTRDIDACYIGRLSAAKGAYDLLPIWKAVVEVVPWARLVIAGDSLSNPAVARFSRVLRSSGIEDSVSVVGFLREEEKTALLSRSRVLVFPSYEEGWSLITMEAALWGVVPVVYDLPAYDYLGPELTRVRPGDRAKFTKAVLELLHDDAARSRKSQALRLAASNYSLPETAQNQLRRFREICGMQARW